MAAEEREWVAAARLVEETSAPPAPGPLRLEQWADHLPASVHFLDIRLHPKEIIHKINSQPVPGFIGFI